MEATSAFDLYCYNKQKVQKYVMLHPIWSDSLPQENMWCYTLSGQTVCHKKICDVTHYLVRQSATRKALVSL